MYYDPYAPRIGPTAMPLPLSKIVPYFAGRFGTFEDFLEEFEDQCPRLQADIPAASRRSHLLHRPMHA